MELQKDVELERGRTMPGVQSLHLFSYIYIPFALPVPIAESLSLSGHKYTIITRLFSKTVCTVCAALDMPNHERTIGWCAIAGKATLCNASFLLVYWLPHFQSNSLMTA